LKHELAILKKMIFGSRHEKYVSADASSQQLSLDIASEEVHTNKVTMHNGYPIRASRSIRDQSRIQGEISFRIIYAERRSSLNLIT
jgi:hypothetical protein